MDRAITFGRSRLNGQLKCVQRVARVASGDMHQVINGFFVDLHAPVAVTARRLGNRDLDDAADILIPERAELEHARA